MVNIKSFAAVFAFMTLALAVTPNVAGAKNVGTGNGQQFITGGCTTNADCSSNCCAGNPDVGVCSGQGAPSTQAGKTGCDFIDPNAAATIAAAKAQVAKQGFKRGEAARSLPTEIEK